MRQSVLSRSINMCCITFQDFIELRWLFWQSLWFHLGFGYLATYWSPLTSEDSCIKLGVEIDIGHVITRAQHCAFSKIQDGGRSYFVLYCSTISWSTIRYLH